MCGICGVYHHRSLKPVPERLLRGMLARLRHRGPDDEGALLDGDMAFGMRRLSIIDLAGGKQPSFNESGHLAVVFNGEIYNYRELAEGLRARGHVLASDSDTEVIVHLYEEYGERCLDYLRGMFAFALWDSAERKLFLARDRLGIKPLYYAHTAGGLVFGSEIKALLLHPGLEARLDKQALGDYLSLKYVPAPRTLFEGVASLPPGHLLTCDRRGVTVRRYWDVLFDEPRQELPEAAYAEELAERLQETVRLHLRSDVPFGAFLSGGIDSSLIVALMSRELGEPVKTFSVGFGRVGGEGDELPYARLVAGRFGTEHREIVVGAQDFINFAEKVVWHLDQPIADQATAATYMVAELAARHVKMVLTGEGGDELFAGYARYAGERLSPLFRPLPGAARSLALAASSRLPGLRGPKIALYALLQRGEAARFATWFPLFNPTGKRALLAPELAATLDPKSAEAAFAELLGHTGARAPLNRMLYADTKLWLADFLLLRGDKLTMAHSLEGRVPLLDHTLVEFAARLPPDLKLRGLTRKYLLKRVARGALPAAIIDRKKQGFPIPIAQWLRREARPFVRDLLAPDTLRARGLFNAAYVEGLFQEHESGFADHSALLWGLASLELWQRQFIGATPGPEGTGARVSSVGMGAEREYSTGVQL